PADAIIVLGAAAYDAVPSPVFRARIEHGLDLYRSGHAGLLLFTGGYGGGGARFAESQVARRYAMRAGIPERDILIESSSQTTYQNLFQARQLMLEHQLQRAIVVSDPLHMARALRLCRRLGIQAVGSPTPSTRFRSFRTRWEFLAREVCFYHRDVVAAPPQAAWPGAMMAGALPRRAVRTRHAHRRQSPPRPCHRTGAGLLRRLQPRRSRRDAGPARRRRGPRPQPGRARARARGLRRVHGAHGPLLSRTAARRGGDGHRRRRTRRGRVRGAGRVPGRGRGAPGGARPALRTAGRGVLRSPRRPHRAGEQLLQPRGLAGAGALRPARRVAAPRPAPTGTMAADTIAPRSRGGDAHALAGGKACGIEGW